MLTGVGLAAWLALPAQAAIVASVKPVGFIAAAIAEGVTPVEILLPDGASEHDYALRPSDIKRLRDANLVVWVGPEMEAFMSKSVATLPAAKSIEMSELPGVKSLLLKGTDDDEDKENAPHAAGKNGHQHEHEHHHHGEYNMHLWMSPEISRKTAIAIHAKLLELMPADKHQLDANLQHFEAELSSADAKINSQLAPVKDKGYFVFMMHTPTLKSITGCPLRVILPLTLKSNPVHSVYIKYEHNWLSRRRYVSSLNHSSGRP